MLLSFLASISPVTLHRGNVHLLAKNLAELMDMTELKVLIQLFV